MAGKTTEGSAKPLLRALRGEAARTSAVVADAAGRALPAGIPRASGQGRRFVELCLTPELAAEVTLQPIRRYGMDARDPVLGYPVGAAGAGTAAVVREGEGRSWSRSPKQGGIAGLRPGGIGRCWPRSCEAVRRVRAGLPDETALIGFAGAPWTVATYMVEGGTSRDFAGSRPGPIAIPTGLPR